MSHSQKRLEACLILGCYGYVNLNFNYCSKVSNIIFDLTKLSEENYLKILEFLDHACDLFSKPMNDYNKCVNALSLLYSTYHAYDAEMLHRVQHFLKMHRNCGIWLMLVMKEDLDA